MILRRKLTGKRYVINTMEIINSQRIVFRNTRELRKARQHGIWRAMSKTSGIY